MIRQNQDKDKILSFTKQLVLIPSFTGNEDRINKALDLVKKELAEYSHESFERNGIKSLLYFNTSKRPSMFKVLFNCHLDVVSGDKEQFQPFKKEGRLYGRGTIDMKAAAAAEILVFKDLAKKMKYPFGLQIVTDEETGGFDGTGYQVERGIRANFVITGESTDLQINVEHKGVLVLKLTFDTQKSGHAAYLWEGDNVILHINKFINSIIRKYPIPKKSEWKTSVNIASVISKNKEHNKVPAKATVLLDFRHVFADHPDDILEVVRKAVPKNTAIEIIARGIIADVNKQDPYIKVLRESIRDVLGISAKFIRKHGASDTRFLIAKGAVGVDFGPKGSGLHSDEEYVDIESISQYAAILRSFLVKINISS
jgi:succinyl-diaminopimelate desuccinylase